MDLKSILKKVSYFLQIFLHVLDLGTDILTLLKYKEQQSITVFGLALGSLILSLPVGVVYYIYQLRVCQGRSKSKDTMITIKLLEVLLESVLQLLINLYVLSSCDQEISLVQYISAGISFLSICVAVFHFDTTIKLHSSVSLLQKLLILTYRTSYLAGRLLAFIYFTFLLHWWSAALVISHWVIGFLCLGQDDLTITRSVVAVLLNTIVYIGEASGLKALAILLLYTLENVAMVVIPYMVTALQQSDQAYEVRPTSSLIDYNQESNSTMEYARLDKETATGADVFASNDFYIQTNGAADADELVTALTENSTTSSLFESSQFCLYENVLLVNLVLNVVAVAACIFYALSFHRKWCMKGREVEEKRQEPEVLERRSFIIPESEL